MTLPLGLVVLFPQYEFDVIEEARDYCFLLSFFGHHSIKLGGHVLAGLVVFVRL